MTAPGWIWAVLGYALGSIPFGYILTRLFTGEDIRASGSGATGATNVSRKLGAWGGLATLLLDAGKGALAVFLAHAFTHDPRWTALAGLASVLGHCYPVFLGFRGGKAVATALGVFLMSCPPAVGVAAALFVLVVWTTRYVSLASLLAAAFFPILYWLFHGPEAGVVAASCTAILIIWRHRENIRRLLNGTERKFSLRRKV
jgi:acyl phosphate:glycerol-3-phosphate acyltransferase